MLYFIVNPSSRTGLGLSVWTGIEAELKKRTLTYQVYFTEYPFHSMELTKTLCEAQTEPFTLGVLGGDGTFNEVLFSVPKDKLSLVTFVYIPSGSSNDLARSLGITPDPVTVVDHLICNDHIIDMDYGNLQTENNGVQTAHRFAVSAGIGFDAAVCEEVSVSPLKKILNKIKLGKLSYLLIAIKNLFTCPTVNLRIQVDDAEYVSYKKVLFIAAMNQNIEGGGLAVAPDADPTDHLLSLCIVHDFPRLKAFILLPALALGGKHVHFKEVSIINCKQADIIAEEPMSVHTDGEVCEHTSHLTFSCSDDTIRMIV